MPRSVLVIRLEAEAGLTAITFHGLRAILKTALRRHGLRCISLERENETTPLRQTNPEAT